MLHNPSLNERSECRLGVLMTARLAEDVPRRGTMREARNDGGSVLLRIKDAFSLFEAGSKFTTTHQQSPVCARFVRLDWGYEKFSLFEAATDARSSALSER